MWNMNSAECSGGMHDIRSRNVVRRSEEPPMADKSEPNIVVTDAPEATDTAVIADGLPAILLHQSPGRVLLRGGGGGPPPNGGGPPRHAVQGQCRPPAPHSQAAPPGHELGNVRCEPACPGQSDRVVY